MRAQAQVRLDEARFFAFGLLQAVGLEPLHRGVISPRKKERSSEGFPSLRHARPEVRARRALREVRLHLGRSFRGQLAVQVGGQPIGHVPAPLWLMLVHVVSRRSARGS